MKDDIFKHGMPLSLYMMTQEQRDKFVFVEKENGKIFISLKNPTLFDRLRLFICGFITTD